MAAIYCYNIDKQQVAARIINSFRLKSMLLTFLTELIVTQIRIPLRYRNISVFYSLKMAAVAVKIAFLVCHIPQNHDEKNMHDDDSGYENFSEPRSSAELQKPIKKKTSFFQFRFFHVFFY